MRTNLRAGKFDRKGNNMPLPVSKHLKSSFPPWAWSFYADFFEVIIEPADSRGFFLTEEAFLCFVLF